MWRAGIIPKPSPLHSHKPCLPWNRSQVVKGLAAAGVSQSVSEPGALSGRPSCGSFSLEQFAGPRAVLEFPAALGSWSGQFLLGQRTDRGPWTSMKGDTTKGRGAAAPQPPPLGVNPGPGSRAFWHFHFTLLGFQVVLVAKNPPISAADIRTMVRSLGREDPLEEDTATHSSVLGMENPMDRGGLGLQSTGWQRSDLACTHRSLLNSFDNWGCFLHVTHSWQLGHHLLLNIPGGVSFVSPYKKHFQATFKHLQIPWALPWFYRCHLCLWASLVAQLGKNPAMWETWVRSLGWEDPLEKGKATHSSFWPGEFQRLYSSWGLEESDTTERFSLLLSSLSLR